MEPLLKVSPRPITPLVPILVKKTITNKYDVLKKSLDTVYAVIKIIKIHVHGQLAFLSKNVI